MINVSSGSRYYFRILDTRPEGPAESLDVVRDTVIEDVKLLKAMAMLEAQASAYHDRTVQEGITAVADALELQVQWDKTVTRTEMRQKDKSLDPTFNLPEIRNAILDAASTLNPLDSMEELGKKPESVVTVLVPSLKGLVVSQLQKWKPMTIEAFRQSAVTIATRARSNKTGGAQLDAFSFESLSERMGYEQVRNPDDEDMDESVDDDSSNDPQS